MLPTSMSPLQNLYRKAYLQRSDHLSRREGRPNKLCPSTCLLLFGVGHTRRASPIRPPLRDTPILPVAPAQECVHSSEKFNVEGILQ